MRNIVPSIGRKTYQLYRDTGENGYYEHGEWIESPNREIVNFKANIQPAYQGYLTKMLPQGDREKECIWFSSLHYIYTSRSNGTKLLEADYVLYNGALWKVGYTMSYQNLGFHVECLATKVPESEKERITGAVYGRK